MRSRRRPVECEEGPEAAKRFDESVSHLLTVTKQDMAVREAAYQQERSTKDRPGPKPRRKTA